MKNRFIKYGAIFCLMTSFLTACTKLIEIPENPPSKIPGQVLFADSAGIMSAWAGIYTGFNPTQLNFYSAGVTILTGLASDELITSPNGFQGDVAIMNNDVLSTEGRTTSYWRDAYVNLLRINSCLENIQGTNAISERLKNQLIGEAKVARAYTYFHLANLYGGVPLVTGTDYEVNKRLPRATVDAVYNLILSDLTEAKGLLMDDYPSEGRARPNKMVANALLARVYLYKGEWNDAELAATVVITSGAYSLAPLASIFLKGSDEAIWQLPSNGTFCQTAEAFNFVPAPWNSFPDFILSPNLQFESGDARQTVWTGTMTVSGSPYTYPAKYKQRELNGTPAEDYVLIRLSEMFLIRAEARARLEKNTEAIADLNRIRNMTRVGLPEYSGGVTSAAIIAAILKERRIELYCEGGHRWYDLKRTGTIDQVLGVKSPDSWQSTDALFPIPEDQRILNPFLTQNPGYQ
jgi:starch-binding outer membrane protein, SusD/RagB family